MIALRSTNRAIEARRDRVPSCPRDGGHSAAELEMLVARSKEERRHVAPMLLQLLRSESQSQLFCLRPAMQELAKRREGRRCSSVSVASAGA